MDFFRRIQVPPSDILSLRYAHLSGPSLLQVDTDTLERYVSPYRAKIIMEQLRQLRECG